VAGQYEQAEQLLTLIGNRVSQWQRAYDQTGTDSPQIAPFIQPWQLRANRTQQLLNAMALKLKEVLSG
jgi:hypothetical protein